MSSQRVLPPSWLAGGLTRAQRTLRPQANRRILKNIAALSTAQGMTYVLPLLVLPYTAKVLGPKHFGMLALTQALVQYSTLITNYGFAYSATRQAAVNHDRPEKLAELLVNVFTAKSALMLACLLVSIAAFASFSSLRPVAGPYLCGFLAVAGSVFCQDWYFQAIEEMTWITVINVVPKLIFTPLIFVFVKAPSDYGLVLLFQSAAVLSSGIAGAVLACHRLCVPLPAPTLRGLLIQLSEGWRTFLATVCTNLYTATNTVILGLMTSVTVVGYYSAAQKVVAAVQSLWSPISQSLYPHFCKSFHAGSGRAAIQLRRLLLAVLAVTLAGASATALAAPHLVPLYLGIRFAGSVSVIRILIFSVCAVTANTVLGLHGMLAAGLYASFVRVVAAAAAVSLIVAPLAILLAGHIGLALSAVMLETSIGLAEYSILRGKGLI